MGLRILRTHAALLSLFILALVNTSLSAQAAPPKQAHIIIDHATGQVLSASAPDEPRYPASLTKMMTLYMLFDALKEGRVKLDTPMKVSAYAARQSPTKLNVAPGETVPVDIAIKALVVRSANDVAVVVAEHLAGSEQQFAKQMTLRAAELGMNRTTFRNPHGLPNSAQRTTARDLATLARALLRDHPRYYPYFATEAFSFQGNTYRSHNRLMLRYEGMDGLKTGFINASGFNLASTALRDGRRLVGVVLGGSTAAERDRKMENLLDAAFRREVSPPEPQLLVKNDKAPANKANTTVQLPPQKPGAIRPTTVATRAPTQKAAPAGGWAIQIGAFGNKKQTDAALKTAASKLPTLADFDGIVVPGKNGNGRAIYRARFIGLTEKEAARACTTLKKGGGDCLAMRNSAS